MMPPVKPSGRNTTTVITVAAKMATDTSRVPVMMAVFLSPPSCTCRKMFSSTTIELSTTRPMATVKPESVMMLSVMLSGNSRSKKPTNGELSADPPAAP